MVDFGERFQIKNLGKLAVDLWTSTFGAHPVLIYVWVILSLVIFVLAMMMGLFGGEDEPGAAKKPEYGIAKGLGFWIVGSLLAFISVWQIYTTIFINGLILPYLLWVFPLAAGIIHLGLKRGRIVAFVAAGFWIFFWAFWFHVWPINWSWWEFW